MVFSDSGTIKNLFFPTAMQFIITANIVFPMKNSNVESCFEEVIYYFRSWMTNICYNYYDFLAHFGKQLNNSYILKYG